MEYTHSINNNKSSRRLLRAQRQVRHSRLWREGCCFIRYICLDIAPTIKTHNKEEPPVKLQCYACHDRHTFQQNCGSKTEYSGFYWLKEGSDIDAFNYLKYDAARTEAALEQSGPNLTPSSACSHGHWPFHHKAFRVVSLFFLFLWKNLFLHDSLSHCLSIISLHLSLISFICNRFGLFPNCSTIWCITSASISRAGSLLWQAV